MASPDKIAQDVIGQMEELVSHRSNFDNHWRDVAEKILPDMQYEFQSKTPNRTTGEKRNDRRVDSTASIALGRFAAIMDSLLTPRNQTWHHLKIDNEDLAKEREVELWFEQLNKVVFKQRYAPLANFASQNQMIYKNLGAFGNGPMFIDASVTRPGLRYKAVSLGGVFFTENHQGLVDTVFRRFFLTPLQAVNKWGDKVPDKIRKKAEGTKPDRTTQFEFIHCVKPNEDVDPSRDDFRGMAFISYYVSVEGAVTVEKGGFRTLPYAIARDDQMPDEVYARSPAMKVLPSINTLNEQKVAILKQGHRTVDPVLLMHDDGNVSRFSMRPGAKNYGTVTKDGRPTVHTLPVGNLIAGKELMDDEKRDINDVFLVNLFQILVDSPNMTATEVLERVKEKGILLAPTGGRQEAEYLGPMIDREIDVLVSQALLPPQPPILQEASNEFKIEYDSPFSRAQKAETAAGLMRTLQFATEQASATGNVELLDHFDPDMIIPELSRIHNVPPSWMRSKNEVIEIRKQRAQAAQDEKAVRSAPGAAAMVNAMTKASKDAPEVADAVVS